MNRLACTSLLSFALLALVASLATSARGQQRAHPLDPALQMAHKSLRHIQANVDDYTALFTKRCRVNGELGELQYVNVKIRNRKIQSGEITTPMGVYLKFLKPSSVKGREIIWAESQNAGKLVAHDAGLFNLISVKLDPNGIVAMRGQRYPITEIGIEKITEKLIETVERDRQYGECEVKFFKNAKIGNASCTMVQVTHPIQREHFDFYRARVYFDDALKMPVRYAAWSWPSKPGEQPLLEEEYTYHHVRVNVGLTDEAFETSNSEYQFR